MNLSAHSETFFHIVKKSTSLLHQQPAQLLQARRFNPITPTKKVASHCHDKILSDAKTIGTAVYKSHPRLSNQLFLPVWSNFNPTTPDDSEWGTTHPHAFRHSFPLFVDCCNLLHRLSEDGRIFFSPSVATSDRAQLICFDSRFSSVVPPAWCYNVMTQRGCNIPTVNAFPEPRKCDYNFCCDREPPLNYVWFIFRWCY